MHQWDFSSVLANSDALLVGALGTLRIFAICLVAGLSFGLAYLTALLILSAIAIYLGVRHDRFAFVAYGTLYGYVGLSARLLNAVGTPTLALIYFVVITAFSVAARQLERRLAVSGESTVH